MKIHVFIAHMGIGGAERVCVNLANEWSRQGHEVHVVVLNLDNDINTHLLSKEVKVHELGVSRLRYSMVPMLRYIRKYRPKFFLVFGNEMGIILQKLRKLKLTKVKTVVRILSNTNMIASAAKDEKVSPIVQNYLNSAQQQLKNADYIVAQCDAMGDILVNSGITDADRLRVIFNPLSDSIVDKVTELRKNRTEKQYVITFVGRVAPPKQPDHFVKAFRMVKDQCPEARLCIVGDGIYFEQTRKLTEELGLTNAVTFEGVRKDMENVYAESDLVVLCSEFEGMPNALIEAIGCGIPVVSYDCPIGPSEIIVDGVNGYLVELNNIESLAQKSCEALMRDWNTETVKATSSKFRVQAVAQKYVELFETLDNEN